MVLGQNGLSQQWLRTEMFTSAPPPPNVHADRVDRHGVPGFLQVLARGAAKQEVFLVVGVIIRIVLFAENPEDIRAEDRMGFRSWSSRGCSSKSCPSKAPHGGRCAWGRSPKRHPAAGKRRCLSRRPGNMRCTIATPRLRHLAQGDPVGGVRPRAV